MKGIAPFIAYALVILLSVTAITIVLLVAVPTFNRAQDTLVINTALTNMQQLDSFIREVASEASGSIRTMLLSTNGGKYFVTSNGKLIFSYDTLTAFFLNATNATQGNVRIEAGQIVPVTYNTTITTTTVNTTNPLFLNQTNVSVYLQGGTSAGYATSAINFTNSTIANATVTGYSLSGSNVNYNVMINSNNYTSLTNTLNISGLNSIGIYYNASDGTWRNITELANIGQGSGWSLAGTNLNYTLAGGDGYDYGIRDTQPGGSYWTNSAGNVYGKINISNDFITASMSTTDFKIYNSTSGLIFNSTWNSILLDNSGLNATYNLNALGNTSAYYYDWTNQTWKVWMNGTSNSTHGTPNWLDPRNKQEFKWRFAFAKNNTPSINYTFLMTAQDPFVRTFVDTSNTGPSVVQSRTSGNAQHSIAFLNNVNSGNTLIALVWVMWTTSCGTITGVTDTISTSYTGISGPTSIDNGRCSTTSVYYGSAPSSGADTVTFTNSAGGGSLVNYGLTIFEVTGITTTGVTSATGTGTSTSPATSSLSFGSGAFLAAIYEGGGQNPSSITAGSGFTLAGDPGSFYVLTEYASSGITSPTTFPATYGSSIPWEGIGAQFPVAQHNTTIPISLGENRTSLTTAEPGLVGYWNFNEGSGTSAYDSSGNGNTGTLLSGASWVNNSTCKFGNCLADNGVDGLIDAGNSSILNPSNITLSAWVYPTTSGSWREVIVKGYASGCCDEYEMRLMGVAPLDSVQCNINLGTTGAIVNSNTQLTTNRWWFISCVKNSTYVSVYINGTLEASAALASITARQTTNDLRVGRDTAGNFPFAGFIDEPRVYDHALTTSEIQQLYQTGSDQQKSGIYFITNGGKNEEVLFASTNEKSVYRTLATTVPSYLNVTNYAPGNLNSFNISYLFNSTMNNNLLFTLGTMGRINTANFTPSSNQTAFSNETIESVANSTLTYYDIKTIPILVQTATNYCSSGAACSKNYTSNVTANNLLVATAAVAASPASATCSDSQGATWTVDANATNSTNGQTTFVCHAIALNSGIDNVTISVSGAGVASVTMAIFEVSGFGTNLIAINTGNSTCRSSCSTSGSTTTVSFGSAAFVISAIDVYNPNSATFTAGSGFTPLSISCDSNALCYDEYAITNATNIVSSPTTFPFTLSANAGNWADAGVAFTANNWNDTNVGSGITQHSFATSFNYDGGAAGVWHFDEGAGANVTDASGNGNNGYVNNATWITNSSCKYGSCLFFDGSTSYVSIPYSTSLDSALVNKLTIDVWIKPYTLPSAWSGIVNHDYGSGEYSMQLDPTGKIGFNVVQSAIRYTLYSKTVLSTNQWYHVVGVYDGSSGQYIYVNGVLENFTSRTGSLTTSPNTIFIGTNNYAGGNFFNGIMDEVRIYSHVLTPQEIWEQYARQASLYYDDFGTAASGKTYRYFGVEDSNTSMEPITPAGTVLHLRFNDNSTVNVTDSSGLGNNGRNTNSSGVVWFTNSSCMTNFGGCVNFDGGTNNYIDMSNSSTINLNNSFSWGGWFNANGFAGNKTIIDKGNYTYTAAVGSDGTVYCRIQDTSNSAVTATAGDKNYSSNGWHQIFCQRNAGRLLLYADGSLKTNVSDTVGTITGTSSLQIGGTNTGSNVVQSKTECPSACSFNSNVASGNVLVVILHLLMGSTTCATPSLPTDTLGDTFTQQATTTKVGSDNRCTESFIYTTTTSSSSADTITITFPTGYQSAVYDIVEVSGATTSGLTSACGTGTTETSFSTSSLSFSLGAALFSGGYFSTLGGTMSAGSGFTMLDTIGVDRASEYSISGVSSPTTFPMSSNGAGGTAWAYCGIQLPTKVTQPMNGTLDEILVINRSLTSDEINQLYLGGYNRTIGGHWHRVAAADGVYSTAYNLTDHDSVTQQDYDQRMLLINGTQQNSTSTTTSTNTTTTLGAPTGSIKSLNMTLAYSTINITGTLSVQTGTYKLCVQKTGVTGTQVTVSVTVC